MCDPPNNNYFTTMVSFATEGQQVITTSSSVLHSHNHHGPPPKPTRPPPTHTKPHSPTKKIYTQLYPTRLQMPLYTMIGRMRTQRKAGNVFLLLLRCEIISYFRARYVASDHVLECDCSFSLLKHDSALLPSAYPAAPGQQLPH